MKAETLLFLMELLLFLGGVFVGMVYLGIWWGVSAA